MGGKSSFLLALLILILCTTNSVAPVFPKLLIRLDDGVILLSLDLWQEPSWVIQWNHSVTGVLVSDFYLLENGLMLLTDSHTPAFDAGLGHIQGRGKLESDNNHGYWIRDIDEPVSNNKYFLRVGSESVNHRINHNGKTYSLSTVAAGERVSIEVVFLER